MFPFLVRKECWTLSSRGKVLLATILLLSGVTFIRGSYPFLALNQPLDAKVMVVEGWIPTHLIHKAADEFRRGKYQRLLVVRTAYDSEEPYVSKRNSGELFSTRFVESGVPADAVDTLFCPAVQRDRTYHSALSARQWIEKMNLPGNALNVVTVGPHARRSKLLFQKAFATSRQIGVISLEDPEYDPAYWWHTSEGVREVLGESIAYVYARFFLIWN